METKITIKAKVKYPHDDFYLQWEHIFWWQVKFNLYCEIREGYNKLERECIVND